MKEEIRTRRKIKLHEATMILGLEGWGNAGKVSTFVVKYLADRLSAKKFGEIPHEKFHDYFIQRPMVSIRQGIMQSYVPPRNELFYWKDKEKRTDLVLLLGNEPHHDWPSYAEAVLGLAEEMDVKRIYTIGGFLADISQGSETQITSSTSSKRIAAELEKAGVELTNYSGPTSVYSEIIWKSREKKIDVVSLWIGVPLYVMGTYPRAAYDMLKKILELTGIKLDLGDLEKRAEAFEREVTGQPSWHTEDLRQRRIREKETTYIS